MFAGLVVSAITTFAFLVIFVGGQDQSVADVERMAIERAEAISAECDQLVEKLAEKIAEKQREGLNKEEINKLVVNLPEYILLVEKIEELGETIDLLERAVSVKKQVLDQISQILSTQ
jgi:DNA-binding ferritin-like protein (Dps family)